MLRALTKKYVGASIMRRRNAFTIIELLVAMALVMFIMAILSTAFAQATKTFRNLKAVGDMANKLRTVTTLLQHDLAADHFEGKKRLSNPNFWLNGPPSQGYFRIWQGTPPNVAPNVIEGADLDTINSYRSVNHMLAFTVKLRGDQMGDFMTAGAAGGGQVLGALTAFGPNEARYQPVVPPYTMYNSQWAEVTWFLQPQYQIDPSTGIQDPNGGQDFTSGGVPLWTLYRSQRLAVPDNNFVPTQPATAVNIASFLEMSCWTNTATGNLYFNSPMDLTVPARRFGMTPTNPAGLPYTPCIYGLTYPTLAQQLAQQGAVNTSTPLYNADVQATDVVSFDVRLLVKGVPGQVAAGDPVIDPFVSLYSVAAANYFNGNPQFNAATGPLVFDTWTSLTDQLSSAYAGFTNNYSQWNIAGHHASIPMWNSVTQTGPNILAIQITIRVWDFKTQQTREVTVVQAM
jgi:type II secretory pathway pseudopilin PulG